MNVTVTVGVVRLKVLLGGLAIVVVLKTVEPDGVIVVTCVVCGNVANASEKTLRAFQGPCVLVAALDS